MEETMTILHFEKDPMRINALEELEIVKATASDNMLNIVNNIKPLYRIPHSFQDRTTANADDRTTDDDAILMVKALNVLPTI